MKNIQLITIGFRISVCLGQCAKKVVSDSPRLVDFAIGLVNHINRRTMKSILLVKTFLGLVEMTSWLVNASFSLPEWQAVKIIFFVPSFGER